MTTATLTRTGKLLLTAVLLSLVLVPAGIASDQEEEEPRSITWLGYNQALAQGRDFDKPVYMHFTASWCKWCRKMEKETYTDPRVIRYLSENFAAVMVDTEVLPSLARKYQVDGLPTLWFLDAQGKSLTRIEGYVGPDKLLRVLEYVSTKAYDEVDYQTWVRRHPSR